MCGRRGTGEKQHRAGALEPPKVWTVAPTKAPNAAPPLLGSESPAGGFPTLASESAAVTGPHRVRITRTGVQSSGTCGKSPVKDLTATEQKPVLQPFR